MRVGYVLRLVSAVTMVSLPTDDGTGGSENRGGSGGRYGVAAGLQSSRRVIRAAASSSAPAVRCRVSLTTEEKEQAVATIATATKQAKWTGPLGEDGSSGAMLKASGEGEKAKQAKQGKQAKNLQSWAAKAKRTVPSLLELLESEATTFGVEHARLIKSHVEGISEEKAARVRA